MGILNVCCWGCLGRNIFFDKKGFYASKVSIKNALVAKKKSNINHFGHAFNM
jgi:hypothetical protein